MPVYQNNAEHRQAVVNTLRSMSERGLNKGSEGNVSVRTGAGMLITPTGVRPEVLTADDVVHMTLAGVADPAQLKPSSEWAMHAAVYRARAEVMAVVHCHSPHATMLACTGRAIPAMHYMVAAAGSDHIPLAGYARFGTEELSQKTVAALVGTRACLLANHGQITLGDSLVDALVLAELVEEQARIYWGTLAIGGPVVLDGATDWPRCSDAFTTYGQQDGDA